MEQNPPETFPYFYAASLEKRQDADLYYKRAMAQIFVGNYIRTFDRMYGLSYLDHEAVKPILDDFHAAEILNPQSLDYIKDETRFLFEYTYTEEHKAIYDSSFKENIYNNCKLILDKEPDNQEFLKMQDIIRTARSF